MSEKKKIEKDKNNISTSNKKEHVKVTKNMTSHPIEWQKRIFVVKLDEFDEDLYLSQKILGLRLG